MKNTAYWQTFTNILSLHKISTLWLFPLKLQKFPLYKKHV